MKIEIRLHQSQHELEQAAALMTGSEPWITLKRNYQAAMATLKDPINEVYVILADREPAGFAILKMKGFLTGYIQTIAVEEKFRGCGIGSAAIALLEERIFRASPNVFLCVSSFNTRAQQLYQKLGYQKVGVLTDYIEKGYDEWLMRKTRSSVNDFKG